MVDAVAAGAWPEKENQNASRINQIYEHVKQVRTHGGLSQINLTLILP